MSQGGNIKENIRSQRENSKSKKKHKKPEVDLCSPLQQTTSPDYKTQNHKKKEEQRKIKVAREGKGENKHKKRDQRKRRNIKERKKDRDDCPATSLQYHPTVAISFASSNSHTKYVFFLPPLAF